MIRPAAKRAIRNAMAGLRDKSFVAPGHYYSPIPNQQDVGRALRAEPGTSGIDLREREQLGLLNELGPLTKGTLNGPRYRPDNGMFPEPDAAIYRGIIRSYRPALIVEIGSGFSSAAAMDAADTDGLNTRFEFIDPNADRLDSLLGPKDASRVEIQRQPIQDVESSVFDRLAARDILFIDSTHISKAGSDVNYLMFRILPRLTAGVLIHFHDIHWPFEYPPDWFAEGRSWNEAYLLHAFLAYNYKFRILIFASYLQNEHTDVFNKLIGEGQVRRPGSIWLEKTS